MASPSIGARLAVLEVDAMANAQHRKDVMDALQAIREELATNRGRDAVLASRATWRGGFFNSAMAAIIAGAISYASRKY